METVYLVDGREGVSGDMLLAAMLGLLPDDLRNEAVLKLRSAAEQRGIELSVEPVEDSGDAGLAVRYRTARLPPKETTYVEAFQRLQAIDAAIESDSTFSRAILERVFDAESAAHGLPKEDVHLHEIGREQALLNIAGIGYVTSLLKKLHDDEFAFTTVTAGSGSADTAHGTVGIPTPATSFLLKGVRHVPGDCSGERATPVGVAALTTLASCQIDELPGKVQLRSVGFGSKRFSGRLGRTVMVHA